MSASPCLNPSLSKQLGSVIVRHCELGGLLQAAERQYGFLSSGFPPIRLAWPFPFVPFGANAPGLPQR